MISAELLNGTVLDNRYRLTRKIGKGSYGWVFEAVEEIAGNYVGDVAVKLLAPEDEMQREMVLREIRALAGLTHEYIIGYRTSGLIPDGPLKGMIFLVTELGDCPLSRRIPPHDRLSAQEVWAMGRGLALALAHIHAKQSIHRDVKPENVLRVNGSWKLGDFGLVRAVEGAQMSASGAKGTLRYMAPEALTNEITSATDVYALGVTLLRCLTGSYAHEGETEGEFIANLMNKPPQVSSEVPVSWRPVLDGCLNRDPQRRWTAAQLAQQLELGPQALPVSRAEARHRSNGRERFDEDRTVQLEDPIAEAALSTNRPPVVQRIPRPPKPTSEFRFANVDPAEVLRAATPRKTRTHGSPWRFVAYAALLMLVAGGAVVFATHSSKISALVKDAGSDAAEWLNPADVLELTIMVDGPVYVRREPTRQARTLGTLTRDTVVKTLGKEGEWYKIQMPTGGVAWVHESAFTGVGLPSGSSSSRSDPGHQPQPVSAGRGVRSDQMPDFSESVRGRQAGVRGLSGEEQGDDSLRRLTSDGRNERVRKARGPRARALRVAKERCKRNPSLRICRELRRRAR